MRIKSHFMIKRYIQQEISKRLFKGKAIILLGPRQSGKTTLINFILESRTEEKIILAGDEPDIRQLLTSPTSNKLKNIIGKSKIVFIDEAQKIPQIGNTLKLFTDKIKNVQVIASGSSSFELASRTFEPLTGRKYEFYLLPLSFSELSNHFGNLEEKRQLEHRMIFGSYPEVISKPGEEKENLKLIAGSYLYKDIIALESINKPVLLEKILMALALQLGNEVSYSELGNLVGADRQTVEKYIDILEKAFIIFRLNALSRNQRNEIKKTKKIYFYDCGIRNAIIKNFLNLNSRNDTGKLWENYFISERRKLIYYKNLDAHSYFWRSTMKQEIDYIEEINSKFNAYELKWNVKTKVRFPKTFFESYQGSDSHIINPDIYDEYL